MLSHQSPVLIHTLERRSIIDSRCGNLVKYICIFNDKTDTFQAPKPLQRNWTVPLEVYKYRNSCTPSAETDSTAISEDCLFLNIYVPGMYSGMKI